MILESWVVFYQEKLFGYFYNMKQFLAALALFELLCFEIYFNWCDTTQARAPVDPMDKKKTTPLHLSAKFGHAEVTELLLEHGASVQ